MIPRQPIKSKLEEYAGKYKTASEVERVLIDQEVNTYLTAHTTNDARKLRLLNYYRRIKE